MPRRNLAKLSCPRLYDAVPRERLFLRLNDCRRHALTLVVGPPGAGKTTLRASYAAEPGAAGPLVSAAHHLPRSTHERSNTQSLRSSVLSAQTLFTDRQQAGDVRFRFHDLFRAFLTEPLRQACTSSIWKNEMQRAGRVAIESGDTAAGITLLLEGDDVVESAARVVEQHARSLLDTGQFRTSLGWMQGLGEVSLPPKNGRHEVYSVTSARHGGQMKGSGVKRSYTAETARRRYGKSCIRD